MSAMTFVLAAAVVVLLLAVLSLFFERSDLRRELAWSKQDAERWRGEAVKRGWKNPFEECLDTLNGGLDKLQAVAKEMARAAEIQKSNGAKLKEINRAVHESGAAMRRQNAALRTAADRLNRSTAELRPPSRPPAASESPLIRAVLERLEADRTAGRIESDPKKLN